ncbi:2 beta-glucanase [Mucidula mucida]|nr:2 beta-glucanase [Mucidula mucida]
MFPTSSSAVAALLLASLASPVVGVSYVLTDSFVGSSFLNGFTYDAISDPTGGRVVYVDAATAAAQNLTYASSDSFIVRADHTTVLSASGPGRNSIRLKSTKTYSNGVTVFNIRHMPQGCGTWPAVWSFADPWPGTGEIDILEGVNDQAYNQATLHTSPGCTMPASRDETGVPLQNDCDTAVNDNAGCGVQLQNTASYGPPFNANGGGWYAVEKTDTYIKVFFWARNDASVPVGVRDGNGDVDTANWGTPFAYFPNTSCAIPQFFGAHNIIINLTFCGAWAGAVYGDFNCPSTCIDYVNNNPAAFADAYFDFAWIKHYS